jgi:hypothetical protein
LTASCMAPWELWELWEHWVSCMVHNFILVNN